MAILDQYGNAYTYQVFEAAENNRSKRPWHPPRLGDIDDLFPANDWRTVLSVSQKVYVNSGIIKGAIEQKALFSVGRGWDLVFKGQDTKWGRAAVDFLHEYWFSSCDIRGSNYDFKTLLDLDSIAIDREGDYFILFTTLPSGFPTTQRIPAHRVGHRPADEKMGKWDKAGEYKGLSVTNGVIRNNFGRPVAYNVLGDANDGSGDRLIEAWRMHHTMDPDWYGQSRGIPSFSASLNELRDSKLAHDWEQRAMLMASSTALIEWNDTGAPDPTDPLNLVRGATCNSQGLQTSQMDGGMVRHYQAGSGNKLEVFESNRPGDMWDRFNDRLVKIALAGINWPVSMVLESKGQGTAERADLERAARAVEDRQDVLRRPALRMVRYAIAAFIKMGRLPAPSNPSDWLAFGFTNPPKLNIDPGRTGKIVLDQWRAGHINTGDVLAERGIKEEEFYRQRAEGIAMRKRIAREVSQATSEEIRDDEMAMLTANGNPADFQGAKDNDNEDADT